MSIDKMDTYQLSSLIELTNAMAEESIHAEESVENTIRKYTNKLKWILDFDHCFKLNKNHINQLQAIFTNNEEDFSKLKQFNLSDFKQNKAITLEQKKYYLSYYVLNKDNHYAQLLVFLKKNRHFILNA